MTRAPKVITIDFETFGIEGRPNYPPVPVGVSIKWPGKKSVYYAWGHPSENNCTKEEAEYAMIAAYESQLPLLFHNAKFDVDVADTHMSVPKLDWARIHDTMYLIFLSDPHAPTLSLKPSAERLLGIKPEEQEAVRDWLIQHQPVSGVKITKGATKPKPGKGGRIPKTMYWGATIAYAPGKLVGEYAKGDVDRTEALFKVLYPEICKRGMLAAYDRERELMPILLENERHGVPVNLRPLREDVKAYQDALGKADAWLRSRLGAPSLNVSSNEDFADALDACQLVPQWKRTKPSKRHPNGQRSVAKGNLTPEMISDPEVAQAYGYRNRLTTCLSVFMEPWLKTATKSGGRIFTNWNQVRQEGWGGMAGARTGRMSCNPNFQNIPKDWYDKKDGYAHPEFLGVPELPMVRKYLKADQGCVFAHRDFNQQEFRILAHLEDGPLCEQYREDPKFDMHVYVQHEIERVFGSKLERRAVKTVNFGMLYGMGVKLLAERLGCSLDEASRIKAAQRKVLPGLATRETGLEDRIRARAKAGLPIRTFGGREYYCEEPEISGEDARTFEYKLLNYLVQGSAADDTKQAIINYHKIKQHGRFLVTVHDEINISVPREHLHTELELLRQAMEGVEGFDVPMLTDAKSGPNWNELRKVK